MKCCNSLKLTVPAHTQINCAYSIRCTNRSAGVPLTHLSSLFCVWPCAFGICPQSTVDNCELTYSVKKKHILQLLDFVSIVGLRKTEKKHMQRVSYVQNVNTSITSIIPTFATVITFITHTSLGLSLNTSEVSTITTFVNMPCL